MIIIIVALATFANSDSHSKYFRNLERDFNNVSNEILEEIDKEEQIENNELEETQIDDEEVTEDEDDAMEKLQKRIEDFPEDIKLMGMIIGLLIFIPIILSYFYAMYRSMSIKVTEKNFPEVYEIVKEYTERLGLKKMPNVYIIQGNGILSAFSAFIPFKQYVELYADLVEVAYREYNDMDSLRFIIGHEMAHIRLKHATLHYNMLMLFSNYIPIISSTASRAREYSCDRIAQKLSGSDGIDAIMSLTAGIHLYKRVDKDDYIKNARKVNGFFVWCYNLVSDHPITTKRIMALEMKEGSGKLY